MRTRKQKMMRCTLPRSSAHEEMCTFTRAKRKLMCKWVLVAFTGTHFPCMENGGGFCRSRRCTLFNHFFDFRCRKWVWGHECFQSRRDANCMWMCRARVWYKQIKRKQLTAKKGVTFSVVFISFGFRMHFPLFRALCLRRSHTMRAWKFNGAI